MKSHYQAQESPGAIRCIWMDAGVVAYKLCDRDLHCEECPFDAIMKQQLRSNEAFDNEIRQPSHLSTPGQPQPSARDHVIRVMDAFFERLHQRPYPGDRLFSVGHLWIIQEEHGTCRIGIDHVGSQLLGAVGSVVLPQTQSHISQAAPFAWLIHRDGAISLHAPFDATVLEVNPEVTQDPSLLLSDPYRSGWMVRTTAPAGRPEHTRLMQGAEYRERLQNETRFLRSSFERQLLAHPEVGATLFDGGISIESLSEMLGARSYLRIVTRIFEP